VSEHPDFQSGWEAGTQAVTVKVKDNAYILLMIAVAASPSSTTAGCCREWTLDRVAEVLARFRAGVPPPAMVRPLRGR
jgi:hypothetical protein